MWCSAADTHLKLLHSVVSGAGFLTGGVFECDLTHRLCVAALYNYMYAVQDFLQSDASSLWCSTCVVCVGACYTRCCDRTSVHLCASSLLVIVVLLFSCQYLSRTILMIFLNRGIEYLDNYYKSRESKSHIPNQLTTFLLTNYSLNQYRESTTPTLSINCFI